MADIRQWRKGLAAIGCVAALAGCDVAKHPGQNPGAIAPQVQPLTAVNRELRQLPAPSAKTAVALYEFDDLTGQFKERDTVQTLSRAVSQGAAPMLIQSLRQAGGRKWFTVLERESLDNLLRERQIVTEMRRIYQNDTTISADELPPLLLAPILISGGIVGFDTNNLTGGAGARLLGIGGDVRYQQDTVTVALRATSVKTGEVLAAVTTDKAITSYRVQGGVFRFVELDELLELEAGFTSNEPGQIALQQAIDKAVYALIMEGAIIGAWSFGDQVAGELLISEYLEKNYAEADQGLVRGDESGVVTAAPTVLQQIGGAVAPTPTRLPPPYSAGEPPLG